MATAHATKSSSSPGRMHDFTSASLSRVIRQPGSMIHFAAFDPSTATGDMSNASAFRKLTLNEELCRPKRVVIETTPNGRSTWRFVPNARWEQGVENEGVWPRVVDVCGELWTLTQDEWDLFKLDREFECLVRLPPSHTTVTKRSNAPFSNANSGPAPVYESPVKQARAEDPSAPHQILRCKRRLSHGVIARRLSGSNSKGQRKKARARNGEDFSSSSEEEDEGAVGEGLDEAEEVEVNGMVVDEEPGSKRRQISDRLQKVRANKEEARRKRREANAKRREKMGIGFADGEDDDEDMMSWTEIPAESSPLRPQTASSPFPKRKVECFSEQEDLVNESSDSDCPRFKTYEWVGNSKRTRTVSPVVARRAAEMKRVKRGAERKEELERRAKARAQALHESLMKELYDEAARSQPMTPTRDIPNGTTTDPYSASSQSEQSGQETQSGQDTQSSQETLVDEEALRQAAIEESKRKIAELEKDRPLWEEQAQKRAAQEARERARAEATRKARAASQGATTEREKKKETAKRQAVDNEQRARDAAAAEVRRKRKQAKEIAQKEARAWTLKGWNIRRALERYVALCDAFDAMNFAKGDVIVFETVPWPVLMRPASFGVEDIDWTAVEAFFRQIRPCLPTAEYKKLVEKSHKRFHPDRWRSRRVLQCVEDEEERECLEIAANTVAQALTPVWQEVTGR